MSDELETQESVVSSESSSEAPSTPEKSSPESSQEAKAAPQEKYVPYDRFQEVIQQKNEFAKRQEELEKRYQALEARFNAPKEEPKKENPLLGRLKTVDPEFGGWAEQVEATRAQIAELTEWKKQAETERLKAEASNELNRLHTEFKVADPDLKKDYEMRLKFAINEIESTGKMLTLKDLPSVYKSVHDASTKLFEARRRAEIASYTAAKKSDIAPGSSKGPALKPSTTKPTFSKDPEEAKAQIVKRAMEQVRSNKSI